MEKAIACNAVVRGCAFTAEAPTEQELLELVGKHAHEAHGIVEVTPELLEQVKNAIVTK